MSSQAKRMFPMLSAVDLTASIAFYRDLLGGTEAYRFPEDDPVFVTLHLGESEIGIGGISDAPLHGQPQRPATGHRVELCVYVEDVHDAVAAAVRLGPRYCWSRAISCGENASLTSPTLTAIW